MKSRQQIRRQRQIAEFFMDDVAMAVSITVIVGAAVAAGMIGCMIFQSMGM